MAIPTGEKAYTNVNVIQHPVITKKVLDVQVKWIDQITDWFLLNLIKESNPIKLAEHTMSKFYSIEPSFRWWVRKVLNKRDRLFNKAKPIC